MRASVATPHLLSDEAAELCELLREEEKHYRRLRRHAWRQERYLKRQDVPRLEENAREWSRHLPQANAARERREARCAELAAQLGLAADHVRARDLLDYAARGDKDRVREALHGVTRTAGDLYRQNGLNVLLSRFCLELLGQEAAIFKSCVLSDPVGRYAGDGQRATSSGTSVMERQA